MQQLTFSEQIHNLFSDEMWNDIEQKQLKFFCHFIRDKVFITLNTKPRRKYHKTFNLSESSSLAQETYFKYDFVFSYDENKDILNLNFTADFPSFSDLNNISDLKILNDFLLKLNDVSKKVKNIYNQENLLRADYIRNIFYNTASKTHDWCEPANKYVFFTKTITKEETCFNRVGKDNSFTFTKTVKYTIKMVDEQLFSDEQKMIVSKLNVFLLKYQKISSSNYYSYSYSTDTRTEEDIVLVSLSRQISELLIEINDVKRELEWYYNRIIVLIDDKADILHERKNSVSLTEYQIVLKTLMFLLKIDCNSQIKFHRYFWEDVGKFTLVVSFPRTNFLDGGRIVELPSIFENKEWTNSIATVVAFYYDNKDEITSFLHLHFNNFSEHTLNRLILNSNYEYEFLSVPYILQYIENLEKN